MAKLKFKNGISGSLVDWTPDATLYNLGSIRRRIESRNQGEAGVIVFDKLGLTLGYESGNNPVYNAFSGNLSAVQRYIFELHGVKTDKSTSKLFEGLADFSTLEWPDMEKKISFNVVDKLSAISILQAVAARESRSLKTQNPPWLTPLNYAAGEFYEINIGNTPEVNIEIIKWTGSPLTAQHVATTSIPVFEAGEILRTFDGTTEKLLFAQGRFFYPGNYPGEDDTWLEAAADSDNLVGGYRIDSSDGDAYLVSDPSVKLRFYKDEFYGGEITNQISAYNDGILKQRVTSFNAEKIIRMIYNQAWPGDTVTNRSTAFSISHEYWRQTINENPFGVHPLEAIKMLAGSIQSYVFVDKNGALIIQKRSDIQNNTVRTFSAPAKKSGGKKKYFWDKLADAVTVTVKSGKIVDGITLTGTATVKKYPGIQPRNELKIEVVAPSGVELTQSALDTYAFTIASEIMAFYGKRHYSFNLSTRLQDAMYDWDLLDLIDINGERYFILSSDLNETNSSATFELVSVTGYDYDFQQARAILSPEKYNSMSTSSSSSSSGSGTTTSITALSPIEMVGSQVKLNYEDNLKLSLTNKLDTAQPIKTTSTPQFARIGIGGAADATYKIKNYGDEWIVGNQLVDGYQSIGGAVDTNFRQKIYGASKITGNLTVDGDIYIGGSINQVNVVDLNVSDHAIRLNKGGDNTTALDGGIEMLGTLDVLLGSIKYNGAAWLSDLNFDLSSGKTYKINNVEVLSSTTLGASVVNSSLTSVGTLTTGIWNATAIAPAKIATDASNRFTTDTEKSTWNSKEPAISSGTSAQYFRGDKTWQTLNTDVVPEGATNKYFSTSSTRLAISATSPLLYNNSTGVISIQVANTSQSGYLSSTDWNTFNGKESALAFSYPLSRSVNTISFNYNNTHFSIASNQLTAANILFASNNGVTGNTVTLGGTLTISTPQDVRTSASPTFANGTLTGTLDQQGTGSSYFGSENILPKVNYYNNLGSLSKKYLTLHAAELWVETLVAQDTIATIGGRVLVGPTTVLVADLTSGSSTINVKHNQMINGDVVYLESSGKVEFIRINSAASGGAGNYSYSVIRNLDGTGANDWYAGDAMFNTGQAGNGFIDLYSIRGIKSSSQAGPTIVGNVRSSSTYNDWSEHWAIGNLNNLYGYATNIYGVGLGKYANSSSFVTIDSTNGIRLRYKDAGGIVTDKITLDMAGNVYIANYLQVGGAAADVNSYSTTISGDKIRSGVLQSNNWTTTTGSYYDLVNGTISLGGSSAPKFSVDAAGKLISTSAEIAEWIVGDYDMRKTIGITPNTKFISVAARSSALSGSGGNYPVVALADNEYPMYLSIGHSYYKSSYQNEFGFTFAHDPFNQVDPLFQVTKNLSTGALTAKLAGWNFNATTLYSVNTSKYTGMQVPAAATTKCFFAGATDNVGANSRFYVQADGKIVSADANGNILFDSDNVYADLKNIGRVFYSDATQYSITAISYTTLKQGTVFLLPNETTIQLVFRAWISGTTTATGKIRFKLERVSQVPASNAEIGNYETAIYSNEVTFGDGATSCFDYYHTIIDIPDGKKFLYELQKGDKVISFNEEKRILEISEIEEILISETDEYYLLGGTTRVTGEHPLFVNINGGGWMKVKDIQPGMEVLKSDRDLPRKRGLHWQKNSIQKETGKLKTATLRMKNGDNPSFIADGFIAHNKGVAQAFALFGICKRNTGLTAENLYRWTVEAYTNNASYAAKIDNIALTTGRSVFSQTNQITGF